MALPPINLDITELRWASSDGTTVFRGQADGGQVLLAAPPPPAPGPQSITIKSPSGCLVDDLALRRLTFTVETVVDFSTTIRIVASVAHKPTGDTMRLTFDLPISPALEGRRRARRIRSFVAWAMVHELDECLTYADGTPVVEPHPERWTIRSVHPKVERMIRQAERDSRKGAGK